MKLKKIFKVLLQPNRLIYFLARKNIIKVSDKTYLKAMYECLINKKLNLKNPQTFNEKLQWLKLYDRNPEYTTMVDKYLVKDYVSKKIGKEYIIPTLGIYDKFEEIDFEKLPDEFVIKPTHYGGNCGVFVIKNKNEMDKDKIKNQINSLLNKNLFDYGREWPYKNVKPRIIIEKYMEDKKLKELVDYKIYCFNGKAYYVMVCFDRMKGETKFIYFDKDWNMKPEFSNDGLKYGKDVKIDKPKNLDKMFEFAKILSKDIPFVRVDFYECNGKLYFGELTFYPSSGFDDTRTLECKKYLDENLKIDMKG